MTAWSSTASSSSAARCASGLDEPLIELAKLSAEAALEGIQLGVSVGVGGEGQPYPEFAVKLLVEGKQLEQNLARPLQNGARARHVHQTLRELLGEELHGEMDHLSAGGEVMLDCSACHACLCRDGPDTDPGHAVAGHDSPYGLSNSVLAIS